MRVVQQIIGIVVVAAGEAAACPVCDSGTGVQVRAAIDDGNFVQTLGAVLLPLVALVLVLAVIDRHLFSEGSNV